MSWLALTYLIDRGFFKLTLFCFVDFTVQKTNCGVHINLSYFKLASTPVYFFINELRTTIF